MSIKDNLKSIEHLDITINQKIEDLRKLRDKMTTLESFDYSGDKINGSRQDNDAKFVKLIAEIDMLERELDDSIELLVARKRTLSDLIQNKLEDVNERRVLYERYFNHLDISVVAHKLNISKRSAYRLHESAIKALES